MIGAILSLNTVQSLSRIISILLCFPDKMNISSVEIKKSIHLYYRGVDIKAKKKSRYYYNIDVLRCCNSVF